MQIFRQQGRRNHYCKDKTKVLFNGSMSKLVVLKILKVYPNSSFSISPIKPIESSKKLVLLFSKYNNLIKTYWHNLGKNN